MELPKLQGQQLQHYSASTADLRLLKPSMEIPGVTMVLRLINILLTTWNLLQIAPWQQKLPELMKTRYTLTNNLQASTRGLSGTNFRSLTVSMQFACILLKFTGGYQAVASQVG